MYVVRDDVYTREFAVHTSIRDNAPQRLRLKVQDPLSARDMLQQIARQLIQPRLSTSPEMVSPMPLSLDSHLLAFSAEENCFIPIDGKPANTLKDFAHLLVRPLSVPPSLTTSAMASRKNSFNSDMHCTSTPLNGSTFPKGGTLSGGFFIAKESPLAGARRSETLRRASRLSPMRLDESFALTVDEMNGSLELRKMKRLPPTLVLMLRVMGYLLSEYSARAESDVVEPTERNIWGLIEEFSSCNGDASTRSLDPATVDAFIETIICSINTGRIHRESHHPMPLKTISKNMYSQ